MSMKTLSLGMIASVAILGLAAEAQAGTHCAPGARYSAARPAAAKVAAAKPVAAKPAVADAGFRTPAGLPVAGAAPATVAPVASNAATPSTATATVPATVSLAPAVDPTSYEPVSAVAARLAAMNARRPSQIVE